MASEESGAELTDQDRVMLVFDYLGPLALLSLVASRRELVKWHAKQGLLLSASIVTIYIALRPFYLLLRRYAWPFFSDLFWALVSLVGLGALLLIFVCLVRALEGERFKIPLLGNLADRI